MPVQLPGAAQQGLPVGCRVGADMTENVGFSVMNGQVGALLAQRAVQSPGFPDRNQQITPVVHQANNGIAGNAIQVRRRRYRPGPLSEIGRGAGIPVLRFRQANRALP